MIDKALFRLRPNSQWILNGDDYSGLEWLDTTQTKPTKKQILAEIEKIKLEYEATEYQRIRAKEYPNIADQLDMLWHAIDTNTLNKTSDFYLAIKAVKDANPKSE